MAEVPTRVVGVVDRAVGGDGEAARARAVWQRVLADLERLRVDARKLVGSELAEVRNPASTDGNAVRDGMIGRRLSQLDVAGGRIEPPDEIRALDREPENPVRIEDRRVRI